MEKCVLTIETKGLLGDEKIRPRIHTFEYPRAQEAKVDFQALQKTGQDFVFCGFPFRAAEVSIQPADVRTLDDWFTWCRIDETSRYGIQRSFEEAKASFNRVGIPNC